MTEIAFKGCQLASEYTTWPKGAEELVVEPKFDGYRLNVVIISGQVTFHCRDPKPVDWGSNCTHIGEELLAMGYDNCMVDGEVAGRTFNETGMVRRKVRSNVERLQIEEAIKFHAFDCIDLSILELRNVGGRKPRLVDPTPMMQRREKLAAKFKGVDPFSVKLAPMFTVESESEMMLIVQKFLDEGFEGGMAKRVDAPYVMDRHDSWLKLKPMKTYEMKITGSVEGSGKFEGTLGALFCVDSAGTEISVGSFAISDTERDVLWAQRDALPGKIVEVRKQLASGSFQASARHAVFVRMRPDRTSL